MRLIGLCGAAGIATMGMVMAAAPASAQIGPTVVASGHVAGACIDIKAGSNEALLWSCHGGSNQQLSFASGSYGQIRVQGMCLSGNGQGNPLIATRCAGTSAQRWINTSEGFLRNEDGLCADVERGGGVGSRVIGWPCNKGMFGGLFGPPTNQRWAFARFIPASAVPPSLRSLPAGQLVDTRANGLSGVIAPGGGNVVAPGGGNVVAAGGANVVAAGGGNMLAPVSGLIAGNH